MFSAACVSGDRFSDGAPYTSSKDENSTGIHLSLGRQKNVENHQMRTNTELTLIGLAAVYLAFFSWPVPRIITQIFHTGIGRFLGLLAVA